jgi:hypothetical protein
MAPRRRSPSVLDVDVPVIRAGWPTGVALLSEDALGEVERFADDPPSGPLLVLATEFADVASDACEVIGRGILGDAFTEDFLRAVPAGDRWTVAEVEDLVARVKRYPRRRHVIAVESVERMERRSLDRLLVTLEEPPAPLLFLLVVPRLSSLPATLRGRSTDVVELAVLDEASRVRALVSRGVSSSVAEEAVRLAGIRPSLAGLLAMDSPLRPLAKTAFEPRLDFQRPVLASGERMAALCSLAAAVDAVRRGDHSRIVIDVSRFDDLTPAARVWAKDLFEVWLGHRRRALLGLLDTVDASQFAAVECSLAAMDVFRERLRSPMSPLLALVELHLMSPPVTPARSPRRAQIKR